MTVSKLSMKKEILKWGRLVKFSHTIFAMPFALSMFVIVSKIYSVSFFQFFWIVICLISARTGAMAFNRILDRKIDHLNPRTHNRELPQGIVTPLSASLLLLLTYGIFLFAASALGSHAFVLAPVVLLILSFYSWTKRFTSFSHLVLGVCLAMAPGGVWYALTAEFAILPIWLMLAVAFWVAGFDIIYSCQDRDFDVSKGLYSVPAKIGIHKSLTLARSLHTIALLFLVGFGYAANMGVLYFAALFIFAGLIISQHFIVKAEDLSRVNEAFFVRNGLASVIFFVGVLLDRLL